MTVWIVRVIHPFHHPDPFSPEGCSPIIAVFDNDTKAYEFASTHEVWAGMCMVEMHILRST